ncbi:hypothetical protein HG531_008099 [Fusarium graminearum]|nr:hypothetical protein HG531_008099 [Fusarium graminearum]
MLSSISSTSTAVGSMNRHLLEAVKVTSTDDVSEISAVLSALWEEGTQLVVEFSKEWREDTSLNEDVVVGHANLACIQSLLPKQSASSQLEVGVLGDKGWVLATKLEKHRSQGLGRLFGNNLTDDLAACKANLVELLLEQTLGLRESTVDIGETLGVKRFIEDLLEHHGTVWRRLGWLENNTVTTSNSTNNNRKSELEGEVEGADVENDTERLEAGAMLHETKLKGDIGNRLIAQPLLHVVGHIKTFLLAPVDLG